MPRPAGKKKPKRSPGRCVVGCACEDIPSDLGLLIRSLPDIGYLKDSRRRYAVVNRAFARMLAIPAGRIVGRTDAGLLPFGLRRSLEGAEKKAIRTRKPVRIELTFRSGEKKRVYDVLEVPLFTEAGRCRGILGLGHEVTERREALDALRESEDKYRTLFSEADDAIFMADARTGLILDANAAAAALLGRPVGKIVGMHQSRLHPSDDSARYRELFAAHAEAGRAVTFEAEVVRQDGTRVPVYISASAMTIGGKRVIQGIFKDVSALEGERERHLSQEKLLRQAAEDASQAKDEFLALLSHELRTPMTAMMGWTWLLRSREMGSKEASDALDVIERNMNRQSQIIEDLLDLSRIVTGKMRLEPRVLELAPLVLAAVDVVLPMAQARAVRLVVPDRFPALKVLGDPDRLRQVFWNLLSNAVKFTEGGGEVRVDILRSGKDALVAVRDTGLGISPEYLEHVFDTFTQAETSLTRGHGGLGMGLAIVHKIVELHGGKVRARSNGLGRGSEFTVSLAATTAEVRAADASRQPERPEVGGPEEPVEDLTGVRVLVVDDDPDSREMLRAVLELCGAEVAAASSAAGAMEAFAKKRSDVAILDVSMPGEEGFSLLRRIRLLGPERGGNVPAAALTSSARAEDRTRALRAGFQMYLPKPVEPTELAVVVRHLAKK